VYIRGGETEVNKEGNLFLGGTKLMMEPAHDRIPSINLENNVSAQEYVEV
jgi:hypothetical protein